MFAYQPLVGEHKHTLCVKNHRGKIDVSVTCNPLSINDAPIDTTQKEYLIDQIGGFCIRYERDVFVCHPTLRDILEMDLRQVPGSAVCKNHCIVNTIYFYILYHHLL